MHLLFRELVEVLRTERDRYPIEGNIIPALVLDSARILR